MTYRRARRWGQAGVLLALLAIATTLHAQAIGYNLRGDIGLKAGSAPVPGAYATLLYYGVNYEGIRNADGDRIARGLDAHMGLLAAPGISVMTKSRFLTGQYGFQLLFPFSRQRVALAVEEFAVEQSQGFGFTDMYIQPLLLGWTLKRADVKAGYAVFAPTGGTDHTLDMWAHELSAGSTVYFDPGKTWHFAALASYEIHHRKRTQDIRVGDLLTIEGGLGASFLEGKVASAGLAYVAQWKLTHDGGDDFPAVIRRNRNRIYGAGPEVIFPVYGKGTFIALLTARYIWEFGGRSTFQGQPLTVGLTFAQLNLP